MKWAAAHNSANPALKNWPVPDASSNVSLSLFPCTYLKSLPKQDLKKKTANCRNCNGLIFVLVHFRWKSRYHCLLHSAHFLLEFAQLSLRRRVVSVSHYFTVYIYINNHHHPYVHRQHCCAVRCAPSPIACCQGSYK